jgi:membrane associated rhomboid family serine protease
LGYIFTLLAACYYYSEWRKTERSFVLDVSRESLLVYSAHLLVIYGRFWNDQSPAALYGGSFSVAACIAGTIGLILLMILAAKVWGWTKQRPFPWARYVSYATGLTVLIIFVIRRY